MDKLKKLKISLQNLGIVIGLGVVFSAVSDVCLPSRGGSNFCGFSSVKVLATDTPAQLEANFLKDKTPANYSDIGKLWSVLNSFCISHAKMSANTNTGIGGVEKPKYSTNGVPIGSLKLDDYKIGKYFSFDGAITGLSNDDANWFESILKGFDIEGDASQFKLSAVFGTDGTGGAPKSLKPIKDDKLLDFTDIQTLVSAKIIQLEGINSNFVDGFLEGHKVIPNTDLVNATTGQKFAFSAQGAGVIAELLSEVLQPIAVFFNSGAFCLPYDNSNNPLEIDMDSPDDSHHVKFVLKAGSTGDLGDWTLRDVIKRIPSIYLRDVDAYNRPLSNPSATELNQKFSDIATQVVNNGNDASDLKKEIIQLYKSMLKEEINVINLIGAALKYCYDKVDAFVKKYEDVVTKDTTATVFGIPKAQFYGADGPQDNIKINSVAFLNFAKDIRTFISGLLDVLNIRKMDMSEVRDAKYAKSAKALWEDYGFAASKQDEASLNKTLTAVTDTTNINKLRASCANIVNECVEEINAKVQELTLTVKDVKDGLKSIQDKIGDLLVVPKSVIPDIFDDENKFKSAMAFKKFVKTLGDKAFDKNAGFGSLIDPSINKWQVLDESLTPEELIKLSAALRGWAPEDAVGKSARSSYISLINLLYLSKSQFLTQVASLFQGVFHAAQSTAGKKFGEISRVIGERVLLGAADGFSATYGTYVFSDIIDKFNSSNNNAYLAIPAYGQIDELNAAKDLTVFHYICYAASVMDKISSALAGSPVEDNKTVVEAIVAAYGKAVKTVDNSLKDPAFAKIFGVVTKNLFPINRMWGSFGAVLRSEVFSKDNINNDVDGLKKLLGNVIFSNSTADVHADGVVSISLAQAATQVDRAIGALSNLDSTAKAKLKDKFIRGNNFKQDFLDKAFTQIANKIPNSRARLYKLNLNDADAVEIVPYIFSFATGVPFLKAFVGVDDYVPDNKGNNRSVADLDDLRAVLAAKILGLFNNFVQTKNPTEKFYGNTNSSATFLRSYKDSVDKFRVDYGQIPYFYSYNKNRVVSDAYNNLYNQAAFFPYYTHLYAYLDSANNKTKFLRTLNTSRNNIAAANKTKPKGLGSNI